MSQEERQRSQEDWQRFNTSLFNFFVERRRRLFTWTQNPIHALEAYRAARAGKIDIPSWILEVFDGWADALCVRSPKGAKEITAALGLVTKGGPSLTAQAEKDARDWWIAERVLVLRERDPKREMLDVFGQVAEDFHLSSERVAQIWYSVTGRIKH